MEEIVVQETDRIEGLAVATVSTEPDSNEISLSRWLNILLSIRDPAWLSASEKDVSVCMSGRWIHRLAAASTIILYCDA